METENTDNKELQNNSTAYGLQKSKEISYNSILELNPDYIFKVPAHTFLGVVMKQLGYSRLNIKIFKEDKQYDFIGIVRGKLKHCYKNYKGRCRPGDYVLCELVSTEDKVIIVKKLYPLEKLFCKKKIHDFQEELYDLL